VFYTLNVYDQVPVADPRYGRQRYRDASFVTWKQPVWNRCKYKLFLLKSEQDNRKCVLIIWLIYLYQHPTKSISFPEQ